MPAPALLLPAAATACCRHCTCAAVLAFILRVSHFCITVLCRTALWWTVLHAFVPPCPHAQVPGSGCLVAAVGDGIWDLEEDDGDRFNDPACWLLPVPVIAVDWEDGVRVDIRNAQLQEEAGLLPAVLAAAVPAGHTLATLYLRVCNIAPATFDGCAGRLAAVDQLVVLTCFAGYEAYDHTLQPALGALLRQTPALRELAIQCQRSLPRFGSLEDGLPAEAGTLHHLESLLLLNTRLPHLDGVPEGLTGGCGPGYASCNARHDCLLSGRAASTSCLRQHFLVRRAWLVLHLQVLRDSSLPQTSHTWICAATSCGGYRRPWPFAPSSPP